ncbi:MAG: hypothetical protein KHY12_06890 [Firmicutes bacterium]|nr:hypothetical protein [Bacillota bacterium]
MAELGFVDLRRMSHACIISARSPEEALRTARHIAAAAVCTGQGGKPCGRCRACRKAGEGIHPDIIPVCRLSDDKGRQKREISVDQIRAVSADAVVLPNEAGRKVYIIEDADSMNIPAQNAALKLLEEPPAGVMFLLCVTNAGQLLPTVRSRCTELNLNGAAAGEAGESRALAAEFVKYAASGDPARLCRWCGKNEGLDSRAAEAFVESAGELLADMLCGREEAFGMSREELLRLHGLLGRCQAWLRVNVGVKHIFGLLAVDAIAGGGNRG